jgi:hypothetical protein
VSSMGMDKSGTQTLPAGTWTKLVTFTVRSGYPSTTITNSTLVMDTTGSGSVRYRGAFAAALGTQQFRVVKNGTTVLGTANAATTTTIAGVSIVPGDTLELQGFASSAGGFSDVSAGAANTFLEYNQTTSTQNVAGTTSEVWGRSGTLAVQEVIAGTVTETWGRAGTLSVTMQANGTRTNNWGISGGIYKGAFLDVDGAHTTSWGISGGIVVVPKSSPLPSAFSFADVSVSVHTVDGRAVGDFPCKIVTGYRWSREAIEVSGCSIDVATQAAPELIEELRQWVHWITVWHDDLPVWTGPIQSIRITRTITSIAARDPATFMWRTRVPITRTFTDTAPARIADTLWRSMNELHGMRATPTVLPSLSEDTFTVTAVSDVRMLHQLMDDLVKVGLVWTVIAGRPVLGRFPRDPVVELQECDFLVELERRRDGTQTFNDVRVQGQNWAQTATVELAGLHLQNIIALDDMFGASNIQRAAARSARESATLRDELVIPGGASLHPQAPVTMNDLIPGKVYIVHYEAISQLMRLDQVTVTGSPDTFDVQISLVALEQSTGE